MRIEGPVIRGRNGRILATWFEADAVEGRPSPTVLLCHGFPGYDQFHDLAMVLQRNGFHVMTFHYSGSWGSDGDYSLENGLADTETVLDALLDPGSAAMNTAIDSAVMNAAISSEVIDRRNLFIVGHSLGGFYAAHTFAKRPEIKAAVLISPADMANMYAAAQQDPETAAEFQRQLTYYCAPLNGIDGKKLLREVAEHSDSYPFSSILSGFGSRPTLIVRGLKDHVTPAPLCADALKAGLDQIPGSNVRLLTFDAPHDYLNTREELNEKVLGFLRECCA